MRKRIKVTREESIQNRINAIKEIALGKIAKLEVVENKWHISHRFMQALKNKNHIVKNNGEWKYTGQEPSIDFVKEIMKDEISMEVESKSTPPLIPFEDKSVSQTDIPEPNSIFDFAYDTEVLLSELSRRGYEVTLRFKS